MFEIFQSECLEPVAMSSVYICVLQHAPQTLQMIAETASYCVSALCLQCRECVKTMQNKIYNANA